MPAGEGAAAASEPPLAATSRGNRVARHGALVGDPLDDEQRSDDLAIPSLHETTLLRIGVVGKHEPESRRE